MQKVTFNSMEIDALGEMMNISLGSSATAVSNMLDHRVDITTPQVSIIHVDEFTLGNLEPAMGVKIQYVEGLDGSNIMLLRRSDVKIIVDILMGGESEEEEFELNELNISAVCEVMNQMMGAAATAMSDFLGFPVNISTPEPFELNNLEEFKERNLPKGADHVVVVRFSLKIENALESEFMNVMSVPLAKDLLKGLGLGDEEEEIGDLSDILASNGEEENTGNRQMTQEEIEQLLMGGLPAEPEPEPASNKQMSQDEIEAMLSGMLGGEPEPEPAPASNKQMSQDEIEAMLSGMLGGEPEPEPAPASNKQMSQDEIEAMLSGMLGGAEPAPAPTAAPAPAPTPAPAPAPAPAPVAPAAAAPVPPVMPPQMQPPQMEGGMYYPPGYMGYPPMYYPYPQQPQAAVPEPKRISTKPVAMPEMEATASLGKEQAENLDLIMDVPLQVTVEIGRTHRKVQDILEFSKGSLVVLDRLAGDQVDLFVNGKCIARGDVVVVDDNFGVRITEVLQKGIDITTSK